MIERFFTIPSYKAFFSKMGHLVLISKCVHVSKMSLKWTEIDFDVLIFKNVFFFVNCIIVACMWRFYFEVTTTVSRDKLLKLSTMLYFRIESLTLSYLKQSSSFQNENIELFRLERVVLLSISQLLIKNITE